MSPFDGHRGRGDHAAVTRPRAVSSHEKAKSIVETAAWLAEYCAGSEPAPEVARAIEVAYEALRVVSEANARNQIVAFLSSIAGGDTEVSAERDRRGDVRDFISTVQRGAQFRFSGIERRPSNQAIDSAVAAWRRRPGERSNGEPNKWDATARLLTAAGFAVIAPESLEKAWKRRLR